MKQNKIYNGLEYDPKQDMQLGLIVKFAVITTLAMFLLGVIK